MDMYIYNEYRNSLVVDQYISSELNILEGEQGLKLNQITNSNKEKKNENLKENQESSKKFERKVIWKFPIQL